MNIKTKYSLGDSVVKIFRGSKNEWFPCKLCAGTGEITAIESKIKHSCPDCYGRKGASKYVSTEWQVAMGRYTIGNVRVSLYSNTYNKEERQYMCEETGVGSGTLHYEKDLFKTVAEAEKACIERNKIDGPNP